MADPTTLPDIEAARAAGFSDTDIADALGSHFGADVGAARKAGFGDADIIDHFMPKPEPPKPKATIGDDWQRGIEQTRSGFGTAGAAIAGARLSDIEAAKGKADRGEYLSPIDRERARQYD